MRKSLFVDLGLLKKNRDFRNVFIARTISLLGLGMLSVAIPLQVYELTADSLAVGTAMAMEGIGLFIGLLLGGVLADRCNRKILILSARSICGLGFLGLALNAWLPEPYLWAVYLLSLWDGFFGAIGITALLACMPVIVGRENLLQARAISLLSMRLATVIAPVVGGAIIAVADASWIYLLAAVSTGLTLIPLLSLPAMRPQQVDEQHPLRSLVQGFQFVFASPILLSVVAVGTVVTLATSIRVLFPALAADEAMDGALVLGFMYAAVALGSTLGALISGWAEHLRKPGQFMLFSATAACSCIILLGLQLPLFVLLAVLVGFGYLVSITSLLQYTLVQNHTPDHFLGRVNSIWEAQDASGDSVATLGLGWLGKLLLPAQALIAVGASGVALGGVAYWCCKSLRQLTAQEADEYVTELQATES